MKNNYYSNLELGLMVCILFLTAVMVSQVVLHLEHRELARDLAERVDLQAERTSIQIDTAAKLIMAEIPEKIEEFMGSRYQYAGGCHPEIEAMISKAWYASRRTVPYGVFHRLVWVESTCDPFAVSSRGAIGLTQVMPGTAEEEVPGSSIYLMNPRFNLWIGLRILEKKLARSETLAEALTRYNHGGGAWARGETNNDFAIKVLGDGGLE